MTMDNIAKIAQDIRSGVYPTTKVELDQFFNQTPLGEWYPDRDTRIQVRQVDRDHDRIMRGVAKMQKSGDKSNLENLTCVRFPTGQLKIGNGNHSAEMAINVDETEMDAHIVDFDKDLDSKMSNVLRLCNRLNIQEVEKVDVHDNDIKKELYQHIEERQEAGLDPVPDEDYLKNLSDTYPHVSRATIGQWVSHHNTAGKRRDPLRTYTKGELANQKLLFENIKAYEDYSILEPRNVRGAKEDTGVSQAFKTMKNDKKRKCLVIIHCDSVSQVEDWEDGLEEIVKTEYEALSSYYDVTIEYTMLCYD